MTSHNSIAKRQFLSLATSRESGQFQKFKSIIIARVPLLCDNFGGKVLDRFKFINVENIVGVPDTGTIVQEWENKGFVKLGEAWDACRAKLPVQETHPMLGICTELIGLVQDKSLERMTPRYLTESTWEI